MHPVVPPHLQSNVQRSWSDEHVPVNSYSRDSIRLTPRASSFSASRAPQPQWETCPPPPVPPLPPSLLPGFYSPPSTHANIDLTFAESPRHPWRPGPSNVPSSFHDIAPPLPQQATNSPPLWPPRDQRDHSNFASRPALPPPPTSSYGYIPNSPNLGDGHPSFHAQGQSLSHFARQPLPPHVPPVAFPPPVSAHGEGRFERSHTVNLQASPLPLPAVPPAVPPHPASSLGEVRFERSPTTSLLSAPSPTHPVLPVVPPRPVSAFGEVRLRRSPTMGLQVAPSPPLAEAPAVLPRPASALGEVRFERSPTMSLQAAPSPPPVPPKTTTAPVTPHDHIQTPSGHTIASPSSDIQPIHTSMLWPLSFESQVPGTMSLDADLKRATTLSLQESHRQETAVKSSGNKEDDTNELARALSESLSVSSPPELNAGHVRKQLQTHTSYLTIVTPSHMEQNNSAPHAQYSNGVSETPSRQRPSFLNLGGIDILSPEELEDHAAHGLIMQALEDEEVTRRLQEEEERRLAAEHSERERDDEEVTRQLQEAEEKRLARELREREKAAEERARIDAEFTKWLQEDEAIRLEAEKREREQRDEAWARLDAEIARREEAEEQARKMTQEAQERNDAEFARRMAETNDGKPAHATWEMSREEQERKDEEMARRMVETKVPGQPYPPQGVVPAQRPPFLSRPPGPPQYSDIVTASGWSTRPPPRPTQSAPRLHKPRPQTRPGRAASAFASGPVELAEQSNHARSAATTFRGTEPSGDGGLRPSPPSRDPSPGYSNSARPNARPSRTSPVADPAVAPEDGTIETDPLNGVSYGFTPPDTQAAPSKSGAPFPEVISLFRAPSPPFHIMAPSWRHLMRLLGQLETSIQANLDAIAQSKEEYLLRVVVQFAKLSNSVNTWRTILHLTLDHPIPRDLQNAWRNQSKDTTTLPYSYTLGEPTPYLVNDANSQFYVIPLSAASPFPILPISLPNVAMYLQSVMRDSRARKVQNDPSNGMRRLAKMVADCYPEEVATDQEGRKASRGVGNLLKRVVGLGGEREASQVNEDVYDIITPFRIDQYTVS